jgi:hypothetical protein
LVVPIILDDERWAAFRRPASREGPIDEDYVPSLNRHGNGLDSIWL